MTARLVAVNVGVPKAISTADKDLTGIDKRPVDARVELGLLGLHGDHILDTVNHGGPYQAAYAYAREDAAYWSAEIRRELPPGSFGENLSTEGLSVTDACIGERWAIGTAVVQVTQPRIPCRVFAAFWDMPDLIKRFTAAGRPGAYLSVVVPGQIGAGDAVDVVHRPDHDVTIGMTFRALTTEPELLPLLLAAGELPPATQAKIRRRLGLPLVDAAV